MNESYGQAYLQSVKNKVCTKEAERGGKLSNMSSKDGKNKNRIYKHTGRTRVWSIIYLPECRWHIGITDADGIEQTALGGIKNVSFWGFSAQNHQKLVQNMLKFIYLY